MSKQDKQLQTQILSKAVADPDFAKFIGKLRGVDLFEGNPEVVEVFSVIKDYYKQHNEPLVKSLLEYELGAKLDRKQVSEQNRDQFTDVVEEVYTIQKEDASEAFNEKILNYIRKTRLTESIKRLALGELTEDAMDKFHSEYTKIMLESDKTGLAPIVNMTKSVVDETTNKEVIAESSKVLEALNGISKDVIPLTDSPFAIATGGGLAKGELGGIGASSGGGKSLNMVSLANAYIEKGYNVLYVALEELEGRMYSRFYKAMMGRAHQLHPEANIEEWLTPEGTIKAFEDGGATWNNTLQSIEAVTHVKRGELFFTRYPPRQLSVAGLKQLINDLMVSRGEKIDVIMIDYPDLLNFTAGNSESETGGLLFQEMRAIAQEFNVVMWVATQLNRMKSDSGLKTEDNLEGSFRKMNILESLFILNSTAEEFDQGFSRLYIAKDRTGGRKGQVINMKIDKDTGLVRNETDRERAVHESLLANQPTSQERQKMAQYEAPAKPKFKQSPNNNFDVKVGH